MMLEIPSTVADVMTRDVVSVEESDSISHLLETLKALRFRHLPVTDEERLIGLVTESDLLGIAASNLLPHHGAQDRELQERFRVRDIMIQDVVTVTPETSLKDAGKLLLRERFGCLPVVGENNVLVGILTMSDFVKVIVQEPVVRGSRPPARRSEDEA